MKKSILTTIVFGLLALAANAQSSVNHTVTVKIPDVIDIKFDQSTGNDRTIQYLGTDKLDSTYQSTGVALKVRANKSWKVSAKAATANFQLGTAASTMPASKLGIIEGTNAAIALSTTDQQVKAGLKGGYGVSGNNFTVKYEVNPGYDYPVGDYTLGVVFTVSAQ